MKILITADTHEGFTPSTGKILDRFWFKIKNESPDLLIHAGDWSTVSDGYNDVWEEMEVGYIGSIEQAFERMRSFYKGPVLTVMGNHDFWCSKKPLSNLIAHNTRLQKLCKQYQITWMKESFLKEKKWNIVGFDGWYLENYYQCPTNDHLYIAEKVWKELQDISSHEIEDIIIKRPKTILTHHPISTTTAKMFSEFCSTLILGHWHYSINAKWFGMQILNPGGKYDDPKYIEWKGLDNVEMS
jgi:predicted phosphodiesterase